MTRCKPCKILNLSVFLLMGGTLLTANPVWGITDILPDVVAWGLIWFGLRSFSELNDSMASARKQALYLIGIEGAKLALSFPLQDSLIRSDTMLATLVFSFGEIFCGILFFRHFLQGTEEFARNSDSQKTYLRMENIRFLCYLFVVVRAGASFLPTLTAIPDWLVQYGEIADDDLYHFLGSISGVEDLLNVVLSVLVLITAGVWLVSFLPLLAGFRGDASLVTFLNSMLQGNDPRKLLNRRFSHLHMARICFALGLFFPLDLQAEGIRFLPLWGFPALFAIGCIFMERFGSQKSFRKPLGFAVISSVLLFAAEFYRMHFTVWDLRSFGELETSLEITSAVVILLSMVSLFLFWNVFAKEMEKTSQRLQCGRLYLTGIPYGFLVAYAAVQTAVFTVPLMINQLNFIRIGIVAGFWISSSKVLAAFEENAVRKLLENMPPEGTEDLHEV